MAAQGWTGLLVPESAGGYGQGFAEMAEVAAALAAQVAPEPVTPVLVFARPSAAGLRRQRDGAASCWPNSPKAARCPPWPGRRTPRAPPGSTPAAAWPSLQPCACAAATHLSLRGAKRHVRPGAAADGYIVSASTAEGIALVWLPAQSQGLARPSSGSPTAPTRHGWFRQDGELPAGHLLASGAAARAALARPTTKPCFSRASNCWPCPGACCR